MAVISPLKTERLRSLAPNSISSSAPSRITSESDHWKSLSSTVIAAVSASNTLLSTFASMRSSSIASGIARPAILT